MLLAMLSGLIAAALCAVFILTQSDATPGALAGTRPVSMTIAEFDGAKRTVTRTADLERAVPFAILLPSDLLGRFSVTSIQVGLGPPSAGAAAVRTTSVGISYTSRNPRQSIRLTQFGGSIGSSENGREVTIGSGVGVVVRTGGGIEIVNIGWSVCGRGFILSALASELSETELVRVAASVKGTCE
ncbi:MAG: hypothetical protein EXR63_03345 [Dehalococcoidia bacterium]|nr:hypothetical protein [Dehalococcoidia bacterium]